MARHTLGQAVRQRVRELQQERRVTQGELGLVLSPPAVGQTLSAAEKTRRQSMVSHILSGTGRRSEPRDGLDGWHRLATHLGMPLSTLIAQAEVRLVQSRTPAADRDRLRAVR